MLLRVNPGSLHRSKIHGSMFTFYRQLWSFARNISYMNPNIDNHISCPASLNSQVKCITKSKLSLLSGVWFGSGVPPEGHCCKYSSVEDYFNFTFGLYQSDSCLQMNTFKIFDNLNYCDIHLGSWLRSSDPHLDKLPIKLPSTPNWTNTNQTTPIWESVQIFDVCNES